MTVESQHPSTASPAPVHASPASRYAAEHRGTISATSRPTSLTGRPSWSQPWSRAVPSRRGSTPAGSPSPGVPCCASGRARRPRSGRCWPRRSDRRGRKRSSRPSRAARPPARCATAGISRASCTAVGSWATPPPSSSPSARSPCTGTGDGAGYRPAAGVRVVSSCNSGGGSTTSASADRIRRRCPSHIPARPKCRCGLLHSR